MRRYWFSVVLASCLAAAACASSSGGTSAGQTATVISFNPFTGPDASFGPEMMAGCESAIHAINAAGGVLGVKLTCLPVDTRGDPADAVPAASKMLATTPHVFATSERNVSKSSDARSSTRRCLPNCATIFLQVE